MKAVVLWNFPQIPAFALRRFETQRWQEGCLEGKHAVVASNWQKMLIYCVYKQ